MTNIDVTMKSFFYKKPKITAAVMISCKFFLFLTT